MSETSGTGRRILVYDLGFALLLSACAASRPHPPVPSAGQPQPAAETAAPAASDSDVDAAMRKRGYQPAMYRGERVYCRKQPITGSNLETRVCQTARQIEAQEQAGKDILNTNRPAGCYTKSCN
jgi:hypothetical protein